MTDQSLAFKQSLVVVETVGRVLKLEKRVANFLSGRAHEGSGSRSAVRSSGPIVGSAKPIPATYYIDFSHADPASREVFIAGAVGTLVHAGLDIWEAFNGSTTLAVGTLALPESVIGTEENDLSVAASYAVRPGLALAPGTGIVITLKGDAATQGRGRLNLWVDNR